MIWDSPKKPAIAHRATTKTYLPQRVLVAAFLFFTLHSTIPLAQLQTDQKPHTGVIIEVVDSEGHEARIVKAEILWGRWGSMGGRAALASQGHQVLVSLDTSWARDQFGTDLNPLAFRVEEP